MLNFCILTFFCHTHPRNAFMNIGNSTHNTASIFSLLAYIDQDNRLIEISAICLFGNNK